MGSVKDGIKRIKGIEGITGVKRMESDWRREQRYDTDHTFRPGGVVNGACSGSRTKKNAIEPTIDVLFFVLSLSQS